MYKSLLKIVAFHLLVSDLRVTEYVPWSELISLTPINSSRVACIPMASVDYYEEVSGSIVEVGSSMCRGKG